MSGEHVFSMVPKAQIPRSTFDRSHGHKTTFDEGELIPVFLDEVLPGDTHQVKMTAFARMVTPIKPIMDNLYMDFFFFFVPNRLVWSNWQKFCGEQANPGDSISYTVPTITTPVTIAANSLADYFGLPILTAQTVAISALPFRVYNLIYNQWFRDENLINSATVNTGDGPDALGLYPIRKRGKRFDYFTSCLPQPQKGATPVQVPLGSSAIVRTNSSDLITGTAQSPLQWRQAANGNAIATTSVLGTDSAASGQTKQVTGLAGTYAGTVYPSNLYADLSTATAATINSLRQAFQIQRLLERDARGGTRYVEILRAHFGVTSPDARLQRPEYLGGGTVMVNVNPVAQTSAQSATGTTTPQGNLSAYAVAQGNAGFSKSFVEHGYIIGLACVRPELSYQYGLARHWSRSTRYDYYWPAFANLGEQAVLTKEIYCDGSANDANVFGYQERWAEYRYKPSMITGTFRSNYATPLDMWHLAEKYTAAPTLSQSWIEVPNGANAPLYRCLAVPSEKHFLFDSYFEMKSTRPMPTYSVPGLIDHF